MLKDDLQQEGTYYQVEIQLDRGMRSRGNTSSHGKNPERLGKQPPIRNKDEKEKEKAPSMPSVAPAYLLKGLDVKNSGLNRESFLMQHIC